MRKIRVNFSANVKKIFFLCGLIFINEFTNFHFTQLLFYLMIVIGIKVIIYIFLKVIFSPELFKQNNECQYLFLIVVEKI